MRRWLENLEQFAIEVILGRRQGVRAVILRGLLFVLSLVYARLVQLRLFLSHHRLLRERASGCLVITIGNLTVGGSGKTPVVEKFARVAGWRAARCDSKPRLQERGETVQTQLVRPSPRGGA